ncbi:MAG: hypothetical protein IJX18_02470 [Clostridia bacterium]|nr:hypothetical protein [Clostridia bacterium]
MKKKSFAAIFLLCSLAATVAFVAALTLFLCVKETWTLTVLLTATVIFYHFVMRLFVGYVVEKAFFSRLKADAWWFREKPCEQKIYRALRLRKWKGNLPTYSPEKFDFRTLSIKQLIANTLQAEAVHETIAALSFLPLGLYFITWDAVDFWVYLLTSLVAAAVDTLFVLLQRYNRFRLLRLQKLEEEKENKGHTVIEE